MQIAKLFSLRKPIVVTETVHLSQLRKLYEAYNVPIFDFSSPEELILFNEENFKFAVVFIDISGLTALQIKQITKSSRYKYYCVFYGATVESFGNKITTLTFNDNIDATAIRNNYLLNLYLVIKREIHKSVNELKSKESIKFSFITKKEKVEVRDEVKEKRISTLNVRTLFLFGVILLQAFLSFAFVGQNDLQTIRQSALSIANREQRKNEIDPFVNVLPSKNPASYEGHLLKQQKESRYNNISPYIEMGEKNFNFDGSVSSTLRVLAVYDYFLNGALLAGYPVSLYSKDHIIIPYQNYDHAIIITSHYADKIIGETPGLITYSDLIGREIIDSEGYRFSINNIIYVTDINANTEKGDDYLKYHEVNVGAGKHLLNLYGDFAFVITPPNSYKNTLTYNITYTPKGHDLMTYISDTYPLYGDEEHSFTYRTINKDGVYVENELYHQFEQLYKTPPPVNQLNYVILATFSVVFIGLALKTFIEDILKTIKSFKSLLLVIPYLVLIIYALIIRLTSFNVYLYATTNVYVFIVAASTLFIFALIATLHLYRGRKKED